MFSSTSFTFAFAFIQLIKWQLTSSRALFLIESISALSHRKYTFIFYIHDPSSLDWCVFIRFINSSINKMLVVIFNQGLEFDSTFKIGWRKTAHNSIRKYVCMRVCVRVRLSMVSVKIYCLIRKKREAKTEPFFISLANFYTPPLILFNEIVLFRFFCVLYFMLHFIVV